MFKNKRCQKVYSTLLSSKSIFSMFFVIFFQEINMNLENIIKKNNITNMNLI